MKRLLLTFVVIHYCMFCYAQSTSRIDTIYTTINDKTYVIFPDYVDWVDTGIKAYIWKKDGNTAFFAAEKHDLSPASLVVKYGDKIWHGTIAYTDNLSSDKQYVNLSIVPPADLADFVNEERVKEDKTKTMAQELITRRLATLEGNPTDEQKLYAIYLDKFLFKVSIMRQDKDHYYFKLGLYNKTKLEYVVDVVDFNYKDIDHSTGLETTQYEIPQLFYGVNADSLGDYRVKPKQSTFMYYAIKKFKIGKKGKLELTLREKEGTRVLSFTIPQEVLLNLTTF